MNDFVDHLTAVFSLLGPVQTRKMFGGYGLYFDGLMIGLIADDMLYLKVDEQTRQAFEGRGLEPFEYDKAGRKVKMSYRLAPPEVAEDPEAAKVWGKRAFEAAVRSRRLNKCGAKSGSAL